MKITKTRASPLARRNSSSKIELSRCWSSFRSIGRETPRAKRDTIYSSLQRRGRRPSAMRRRREEEKKKEEKRNSDHLWKIGPWILKVGQPIMIGIGCGIGEMRCDRSLFSTFLSEWETCSSSRGNVSFLNR